LFEAASKGSREAVPVNGVDGCLGPLEAFAVREKPMVAVGLAYGARSVSGNRFAGYEKLSFGRWEEGDPLDRIW
jgi:hypothetical protein